MPAQTAITKSEFLVIGQYVGELHKDTVVDKHLGNLGNIGKPGNPGNPGSPGNPGNRGASNYDYPDAFSKLL